MLQPTAGKNEPALAGASEVFVLQVMPEEWARRFSAEMHKLVFKELKPAEVDRISYALLFVYKNEPIGYVTVRETDHETVYWQFGGVLTRFRRGVLGCRCFEAALEWQKARSKRVMLYTENTNLPMLKMALAYGFLVIGTRTFRQFLMVDLMREFDA